MIPTIIWEKSNIPVEIFSETISIPIKKEGKFIFDVRPE